MTARQSLTVITIAAAVAVLMGGVNLHGQAGATTKPTVVAVVDVQKVFAELVEKNHIEADIQAETERVQRELQDRKTQIDALSADLQLLAPDSDAWKKTNEKRIRMTIEAEAFQKFRAQQLESEKSLRIEGLYKNMLSTIQRMAERSGYDLVMYKDQADKVRAPNQQQLATLIQLTKVLYATSQIDITDQLIQTMNNEFHNRTKAPGQ